MKLPAAPVNTHLHLDTTLHINATNPDGSLVINPLTGKPITIAQDTISGKWYGLMADGFPFNPPTAANKAAVQSLADAGGIHVAHQDERWRGVWVPLAKVESETDPAERPVFKELEEHHSRVAASRDTASLPAPSHVAGEILPPKQRAPRKNAAKKAAKKATSKP